MKLKLSLLVSTLLMAANVSAVTVNWTDWTSAHLRTNPNSAQGTMLFGANPVAVTYTGQIEFAITGPDTNYWTEPNPAARPYTGGEVGNAPPASDLIAMNTASNRTLTFSEAVSDLYFAYISMNGNSFTFNRDFEFISQGHGYWGNGLATKVNNDNGTFTLNAVDGEPHGIIKLMGSFNSLAWTNSTDENWYGFTVGTADLPASGIPEPATYALVGAALLSAAALRRRRA